MDRYKGRSEDDGEKTSFGWPAKAANHAYVRHDNLLNAKALVSVNPVYLLRYLILS